MYENYATIQATGWLKPETRDHAQPAQLLHRLRGWLPEDKGATVLDLGCGSGHVLLSLRHAGYAALQGVDLSPEAIRLAREQGFHADQRDIIEFLREDRSFDLICAFDLLEHFGKDEVLQVLSLIRQRLKTGGVLILQTPNAMSPWACHLRYGDLTHELIFTPMSIDATLKLSGFAGVEIREILPRATSLKGAIRWSLWKFIWTACAVWNLVETGSLLSGIYTRNMIVRAVKSGDGPW